MICAKCGFENNDGAKTCAKCGSFLEPGAEEKKKHRRVVQLPSNQTPEQAAADEQPLETRASRRAAITGGAAAAGAGASAAGSKSPTPRRRSSAAATGKIPALKRPAHEDGKIPADERKPVGAKPRPSEGDEPSYTPPSRNRSTQVIIDDAVLAAEAATQARGTRPARSSIYQSSTRRPVKDGSSRTKGLIIGIAILILLCLVALGVFLVSSGSNEKTISFDTDGGTIIGNQYVMQDDQLARPANPTRPGYEFDGWYLDADYSEEAQFPIDVTQNMTLYAKWKQESSSSNAGVPSTITNDSQTPDANAATGNANGSSATSGSSGATAGSGSATRPNSGSGNATRPSTGSGSGSGTSSGAASGSAPSTPSAPAAPATPSAPVNGDTASNGPVNVSVVAANGSTLSGTVTLHDGYVIPNSSEKAYSIEELKALGLNDAELCIARNEPYARMGYSFRNPQLQAYFNARSWYRNTGWRGELPRDSAGYVTAQNLRTIALETPGAAAWLNLSR